MRACDLIQEKTFRKSFEKLKMGCHISCGPNEALIVTGKVQVIIK